MKKGEGLLRIMGGAAGLIALLAILIAANWILGGMRIRHDFTSEKLYSLTPGTRAIVGKLDQKVTLKLFFNSSTPEVQPYVKNYARNVEDLLHEYALASGRKIVVEKYDPQPDSEAEEWAQKYGIPGNPMDMNGTPIYLGLVGVCGSTEAVLPVLDPRTEELLEYNITRLIYRITHPEKPVIGVISSLPVLGGGGQEFSMQGRRPEPPWLAFRDLGDDYTLREIPPMVPEIPPDINAMIIIHPKELSDKTLFAIDQFVLRGGRLLVFLDPFSVAEMESESQSPMGMPKTSSSMDKLTTAWGVTYDSGKVLADLGLTTRIRGGDNQVEESPLFLTVGADHLNRKDVLTAQIKALMMPFAGTFTCTPSRDLTVTPLITSGEKSCMVDAMSARFGRDALRSAFKSGGIKLDLAVRLTGKFTTAFPEGRPKDPNATNAVAQADNRPVLTNGESTVILVGDTDMLADRFCVEELNFFGAKAYRPLNDNVNFLANSVEQIAGSRDLIGIRCRGKFSRVFDRVQALQEKAMQEWQEKETTLQTKLQETQQQLRQLESTKDKSQRFILSDQQKKAIENYKKQELEIKKDLKLVRKNLRSDIERLGIKVKVANMALMPLIVAIGGIVFGLYRKHRR
jgi:ABC-type uncharacterized transport system involved in gliding motility auxiliary subunit